MRLEGKNVAIRPMLLKERQKFFQWATRSDATQFWYGEISGDDVPTYVVFRTEWPDYYFSDEMPERGQCFVIEHNGEGIGEINHNEITLSDQTTYIDVLIAERRNQEKGLGTEAIRLFYEFLFEHRGVRKVKIEVPLKNQRAIRSFCKAGFSHTYTFHRGAIHWQVMSVTLGSSLG